MLSIYSEYLWSVFIDRLFLLGIGIYTTIAFDGSCSPLCRGCRWMSCAMFLSLWPLSGPLVSESYGNHLISTHSRIHTYIAHVTCHSRKQWLVDIVCLKVLLAIYLKMDMSMWLLLLFHSGCEFIQHKVSEWCIKVTVGSQPLWLNAVSALPAKFNAFSDYVLCIISLTMHMLIMHINWYLPIYINTFKCYPMLALIGRILV